MGWGERRPGPPEVPEGRQSRRRRGGRPGPVLPLVLTGAGTAAAGEGPARWGTAGGGGGRSERAPLCPLARERRGCGGPAPLTPCGCPRPAAPLGWARAAPAPFAGPLPCPPHPQPHSCCSSALLPSRLALSLREGRTEPSVSLAPGAVHPCEVLCFPGADKLSPKG